MFTFRSAFCAAALAWPLLATAAPTFIAFESGPVRPIALSPDGTRLAVANIPDNRVEFFAVDSGGLTAQGAVAVGLEPVALAFRDDNEVWVVNHLSDSISIVRLDGSVARVARTLLTGDEPRDIVFAGSAGNRAFVTTAHRGQQRTHASIATAPGAGDPRLTTAGTPRADVWVFDADNLGHALGGTPLRIVELFGDTPRALAVSPDRATVYAAVHFSGNQTTTVSGGVVCPNFSKRACTIDGVRYPGGSPGPARNKAGAKAPHVGLIVKWNASHQRFEDELGRNWNPAVRFRLPDKDVFAIDAAALTSSAFYTGVGTTLFNMAVNPASGALYVSNTDANNLARFEGPGDFAGRTVQGKLALSRITIIDDAGVQARHLNTHIDYNQRPAPTTVAAHSLSTPLDMVVSSDGATLYVAAFGSSKVGVIATAALQDGSFDPTQASADYIELTGGGPCGLALDAANQRLFVLTRFDNAVKVVDLASGSETASVPLFNPEPATLVAGRPLLYDAQRTSSNGEASCASCHVFGDFDQLAWDLGNPDDPVTSNPIPIKLAATVRFTQFAANINGTGRLRTFHPMKGPMTTQTLRGMINHGSMHWRGDRANGHFGRDARTRPPFDARLSLRNFIVAFEGLLGQDPATPLPVADMDAFTDFALALSMPPNPVRGLDNRLTPAQARGRKFYFGCDSSVRVDCSSGLPRKGQEHLADGVTTFPEFGFTCHGCHSLTPQRGFFGGDGQASFEFLPQIAKIPQLRNLYQKVGMFGHPRIEFLNDGNNAMLGDQVRGFGYLHDGSIDTVFRFLQGTVFNPDDSGRQGFIRGDRQRRDMEQFVLAFDSDLPPITGQQVTVSGVGDSALDARVELLIARAHAGFESKLLGSGARECELIARGTLAGESRGWLYQPGSSNFRADRDADPPRTLAELREQAAVAEQEVTFTCVPYGSGMRVALDRDLDGILDGDEF